MNFIDMKNMKFGNLTVRELAGHKRKALTWKCVCVCGETRIIEGTSLRAGRNKSCGCLSPRFKSNRINTKGAVNTPTYKSWSSMIHRCSDLSKGKSKRLYFDKGIKVCDEWMVFENFIKDMGQRPNKTSLDRIDGAKGYYKENCRWASPKQQANNMVSNRKLEVSGKIMTVSQWGELTGIKPNTIIYRLRRGWTPEMAVDKNSIGLTGIRILERMKNCSVCNKTYIPRASQVRSGIGLYCSQKCNGISKRKTNEAIKRRTGN